MSNVSALYHIVFCTKRRANTLPLESSQQLYGLIGSIVKAHKCFIHKIGGMPNHVHILLDLHQDVALSGLLREMKAKTSQFLSSHNEFPLFEGWANGYYAASISYTHKERAVSYIGNQLSHHQGIPFDDEIERLVRVNGMSLHPNDYQ